MYISHDYHVSEAYDELLEPGGRPRFAARALFQYLDSLRPGELEARRQAVDAAIMTMGITFTVYSEAGNIDRAWPFDIIPRVMAKREWMRIEEGLKQRLTALNLFINDLYNEQRIVKDGVFPAELIAGSRNFRPQCREMTPRFGVWAHISGTDLVRDKDGTVYVLEDNLRVPSGVSYMLENRQLTKRLFPEVFQACNILPVDDYPTQLYDTLAALSPRGGERPVVAVLTPGIFNSAYFEHSYLAQQMGAFLVEGSDLMVDADDQVYMKTISGPRRVDVIYRRIDDDFLIPRCSARTRCSASRGSCARGEAARSESPMHPARGSRTTRLYIPTCRKSFVITSIRTRSFPTYRATCAWTTRSDPMCSPIWTNWWSNRRTNPEVTACSSVRGPAPRSARRSPI